MNIPFASNSCKSLVAVALDTSIIFWYFELVTLPLSFTYITAFTNLSLKFNFCKYSPV